MCKQVYYTRLLPGSAIFFSLILFASVNIFGQGGSCIFDTAHPTNPKNFTNMKQKQVTGISIANGKFKGLLEYTPPGYYTAGNTKRYPVIIYFPGVGALGKGTAKDLCKLLWDGYSTVRGFSLPGKIERNQVPPSIVYGGVTYQFIIISPQYTIYTYPTNFPSANEVDSVIKYVKKKYRVDPTRVYLTGMSSGANMVIEYAGSSVTRAQTVAAIGLSSLSSPDGSSTNVSRGIKPANIALGKLPTRFIHCHTDNMAPDTIPIGWVNRIKLTAGYYPPQLQILNNTNTDMKLKCDATSHNTWSIFYDSTLKISTKNLYQFFIQFRRPTATLETNPDEQMVVETRTPAKSFFVQPNPFTDNVAANITVDKPQKVTAYITNISGQILSTTTADCRAGYNQLNLNTARLPKGMYFLKVTGEDYTVTQKVVKQ
jgi:predicted esterase